MRPRLFHALLVVCALTTVSGAATKRHKATHLEGEIQSDLVPNPRTPVRPIMGEVFNPPTAAGSLVSHGNFLYALMGDRVYKLDPRDLHVISVQRLGAPRVSAVKHSEDDEDRTTPVAATSKKKKLHRHTDDSSG
jgi:hypothetical protein